MAAIALAPSMMGPILEEVQIMVRMVPIDRNWMVLYT